MFLHLALICFVASVAAGVHESLTSLPYGWTKAKHSVPNSAPIILKVALKYQNINTLEALLAGVSTPGSPLYGRYFDLAAQSATFAPSAIAEKKVKAWLESSGVRNIVSDGNIVSFLTTVGEVNTMLATTFQVYTNGIDNKLRTTEYTIPDALSDLIDLISPTTYFGTKIVGARAEDPDTEKKSPSTQTSISPPSKRQLQASCQTSFLNPRSGLLRPLFTPECFKQLYNIAGYRANPKSGSNIAFASFLNDSASYSDLDLYERVLNLPAQNFSKTLINGGIDDQNPNGENHIESNIDLQNIIGLVDGLPVREYITGGLGPLIPDLRSPTADDNFNEPYLEYYHYLLSQPNSGLPHVISHSYSDNENSVPLRYAKRVCNMIGILGLRGHTILYSSGDVGVGQICRDNQGSMTPQFSPQFPASCPYVTSVGGTQFYDPVNAYNLSSGGFSFYFPRAFYQKSAVDTYLNDHISPATKAYYASNNYTNFAGRAFPDISAHSLYPSALVYLNGKVDGYGGTSLSVQLVGPIIALLNDARFRAGRPAMGFLNPFLYQIAFAGKALNDIVNGAAVGCLGSYPYPDTYLDLAGSAVIPYATWNATIGWDPATGLGTPNFQKLKALALAI